MKAVLLAAAATLALAACDRTHTNTEARSTTPAPDPAAAPAQQPTVGAQADAANQPPLAEPTTVAGFVARAALSDMYEIESSRLALQRSQSNEVRRYAQMMIDAHTGTTRQLTELIRANSLQVAPPVSLDRERSDLIADLRAASSADFDDRYIDQQTRAHEQALELMRTYAERGDNPVLQGFARNTAGPIEQHLTAVRALDEGPADDAAGANAPGATTGASNDGDRNPNR